MKKIKWSIMTLAVLFSISSAFVTKPKKFDCSQDTQYYLQGGTYFMAGTYGEGYVCLESASTCTYYYTGFVYDPCGVGTFDNLTISNKK